MFFWFMKTYAFLWTVYSVFCIVHKVCYNKFYIQVVSSPSYGFNERIIKQSLNVTIIPQVIFGVVCQTFEGWNEFT